MGKVLYVGASNIEAWRLARGCGSATRRGLCRFDWVQNSFSLLDRAPEREMFPLCADQGVGFTAFSPLAGGWLTGKVPGRRRISRSVADDAAAGALSPSRARWGVSRLGGTCRRKRATRGVGMSALAIAWVLHHPRVDAAIIGPRTAPTSNAALASTTVTLSGDDGLRLAGLFE